VNIFVIFEPSCWLVAGPDFWGLSPLVFFRRQAMTEILLSKVKHNKNITQVLTASKQIKNDCSGNKIIADNS